MNFVLIASEGLVNYINFFVVHMIPPFENHFLWAQICIVSLDPFICIKLVSLEAAEPTTFMCKIKWL